MNIHTWTFLLLTTNLKTKFLAYNVYVKQALITQLVRVWCLYDSILE